MTTNPAITALALVEAAERRLLAGPHDDGATYDAEVWTLLSDPGDSMIHAEFAATVATELATIVIGIAAACPQLDLSALLADYRAQLLARDGQT
jgi:hypothetical protein